jgi:hypothetical protein
MRDQHIHTIGIQSATYPYATFVLTHPLSLPASALSGNVIVKPVTGVVDIHGTSRTEAHITSPRGRPVNCVSGFLG